MSVQHPDATYWPSNYLTTHNNTLYCAGNNGIYTYDGNNWAAITNGTFQTSANANNELIFIGNYIYVRSTESDIYRTPDNGTTWEMDTAGLSIGYFSQVQMLFTDGTYLFASVDKLYRKLPSDSIWTAIPNTGAAIAMVKKDNNLFAVFGSQIYSSSDSGLNWSAMLSTNFPTPTVNPLVLAGTRLIVHNSNLYYGSRDGVYKSTDNGDNWTRIDVGFQQTFSMVEITALYSDGAYLFASTRNSTNAYKSTDNGNTWSDISTGLTDKVTSFVANNGNIYASLFGKGQIYTIDNGASLGISSINGPTISAYPNPATTLLTINFNNVKNTSAHFTLTNSLGEIIFEKKLNEIENNIDLTPIANGIYTYQLETNDYTFNDKLIIQK